ncbi:lysine exporter LysO-like protein [Orenia metallireducens]|uniref:DUF340 domain-containing protein n=1 Tax=Orenia metallireducens TaxID=1413210 RepID=A0A285GYV4_9FIRM|nr:LysO family transporter [Orenia metallireducens]PRX31126.1 lysine exporter LysO-like protein [Orenia metallireducens]SNY27441.1 Membrane protein of unknown function [Orenia metallireducens]
MGLIVISLIMGILISYKGLLAENLYSFTDKLTLVGLFLLLFTMGVKIGGDPEVVSNLKTLGFKAIVLSLGSVLGSVILLFLFEFKFKRED